MTTQFKQACMKNSGVVWDGVDGIMIFIGSFVYPLLFIATFIDIAEHPLHTSLGFNTTVMMAQSFILEIGATAFVFQGLAINKQGGKGTAAIVAGGAITVLTLISVAAAILPNSFPDWSSFLSTTDDILLIIRAIISVLYGFVAHILRGIGEKETPHQLQQNNQATQQMETLALMVTDLHNQVKTLSTPQPAPQVDIAVEARRIIIEEIRAIVPQIVAPRDMSVDIIPGTYRQPIDDRLVDTLVDTSVSSIDDTTDDATMNMLDDNVVDMVTRKPVNNQLTPRPKITAKLGDTLVARVRNTDKLNTSSSMSTRKVQSADGDAAQRIRKMVKKNPDIQPSEIIQKVNVSRQYASKIKAQILKEMSV